MNIIKKFKDDRYLDISTIAGLNNILPKVSGTGTNITLEGTANAPMKVTGACTICGKNLLNINAKFPFTLNGLTFVKENDGSITINGTTNTNINYNVTQAIDITNLIGKNLTLSETSTGKGNISNIGLKGPENLFIIQDIVDTSSKSNTITSFNPTNYKTVRFQFWIVASYKTITFENFNIKVQLEFGSTATDYEQYVGQTITADNLQTAHSYEGITNIFADEEITAEAYKKIFI